MAFNETSTLLCVSSDTDTIHVFKLSPVGSSHTRNRSQGSSSEATARLDNPARGYSDRSLSLASDDMPDDPEDGDGSITSRTNDHTNTPRAHDGTFSGMLRRTSQNVGKTFAATVGGYLPTAVSEAFEPQRDFAWFKLPRSNSVSASASSGAVKSVVAMSNNSPQVMLVTSDGQFLVYNIDLDKGGEGTLTKQHS